MTDLQLHVLEPARNRNGEDALVPFLLGARRLQLLLVAQKQWALEQVPFQLVETSATFRAGLERLGVAPDHFDKDAMQ